MSKLQLINEIVTALKMAGEKDYVKINHYLDDLLSNYKIERIAEEDMLDNSEDYIQMYINSIKIENYSDLTLMNYVYELRRFAKFIQKNILQAKTADVRQYLAVNSHLKMSTIVSKLNMISGFYNWLVKEEELLKNPCAKISRPKLPKKVRQGLTIVELEKVRAACTTARERAIIEVFYSTGSRLDEISKLDISDIDWGRKSVVVDGKGKKERIVYLSDKAIYYLQMYLKEREDDCPALFVSSRSYGPEKSKKRLSNDGIQYQINKIEKAANIDKPLHPHILRHTFAQLGLNNGMELADLQALMGHDSPESTVRYATVSEERKQTAFRRFHAQ